ncbi:MAG TPA: hypothetical protein VGM90_09150 [Kofleriaceae bacterium]|jgi:hypothetical protein
MAPVVHAPLPAIAALYTISVDRGRARCQPWDYNRATDEYSWSSLLTGEKQTMTVSSALVFTDQRRMPDGVGPTMACLRSDVDVVPTSDALVLDGAKLFYSATACKQALAAHEAVAFVPDCVAEPSTALQQLATQQRFEKVLVEGGTMYAHIDDDEGAERCERFRFKAAPMAVRLPDASGTAFFTRIKDMKAVPQTPRYRYTPGLLTLWLDDDAHTLEYGDGVVSGVEPMFFTMRACVAEIAEQQATRSWQPD